MKSSKQLLQDTIPLKILKRDKVLTEDVHGNTVSAVRVVGQFQKANCPNANGRIYPTKVLKEAVGALQSEIKSRGVLGEYDHPPTAKIGLERVSHVITKLWMEGDIVYGEAEILDKTQYGAQLKALICDHKVRVGISSRGVGDMESTMFEGEEYYKVLDGYELITFDMVQSPSVHNSFMKVVEESTDRIVTPKKKKLIVPTKKSVLVNNKKILTKSNVEKQLVVEFRNKLRGV